ncbi:uncharacterized protein LOC141817530 [Curcuma longa]|uniref:uncharacterized protein LOC141817530 n=1 Tax=Curcuma longa TaxID=136217 RepID=UPI003D9DE9AB
MGTHRYLSRSCRFETVSLWTASSPAAAEQLLAEWFQQPRGVARAYDFFRGARPHQAWVRTVWQSRIQPSHSFTLWLLARGRLPVRARQDYLPDRQCAFCGHAEETLEHLFFQCGTTSRLWGRIRAWLLMRPEMTTFRRMLRTFRQRYRRPSTVTSARHVAMAALVHHLWSARNALIHEGRQLDEERLYRRVQTHVYRTLGVYTDQELRRGAEMEIEP